MLKHRGVVAVAQGGFLGSLLTSATVTGKTHTTRKEVSF